MDWILHPFLAYALQAVGLALCLYLFFSLKREFRRRDARGAEDRASAETRIQELRSVVEAIQRDLRDVEERTGATAAPLLLPSGLNLNKRAQALRMYRRGEPPERIAASLALPCREVELMVKIQQIVANGN